jgi:hypothetical protein
MTFMAVPELRTRVRGARNAISQFTSTFDGASRAERRELTRLTHWAQSLVGEGVADIAFRPGRVRSHLGVLPVDGKRALCEIYKEDKGSRVYVSAYGSVLKTLAPDSLATVEKVTGSRIGHSTEFHAIGDDLLGALRAAFAEASASLHAHRSGQAMGRPDQPSVLRRGRSYRWDEVGAAFGFSANYFAVGGGMLAVRKHNALVIVTHPGGAKSFDYGDYWDGSDLIYTGKGLEGPQRLERENLDAADNRRTLYVFEQAGPSLLTFKGIASCTDWWPDIGPDRRGAQRRVYRFRLSFAARDAGAESTVPVSKTPTSLRVARPFDPLRTPASYAPTTTMHRFPEETKALQEKATLRHHRLLVYLNRALADDGWEAIEEIPAAIDLRACKDGSLVLFEAKTLTAANESHQIRAGLAQLLEYRFLYGTSSDGLCLVGDAAIRADRARFLRAIGIDYIWVDGGKVRAPGRLLGDGLNTFVNE